MNEIEIQRLVVRILNENKQYLRGLKEVETSTKKTLDKVSRNVTALGRTFTKAFTVPLTIVGGVSVKAFADFDSAMTKSTSIMKVTQDEIDGMRKAALRLAKSGDVIQTPTELAESYFFLASAGKNAQQSIALLPKVADFATAGAFDMALATDLLTDAQSALGLSSKDVAKDTAGLVRVSDTLVKANTLANASVQQFSESITNQAGASLRAFSKDIEEGVAVLAAYADQGEKGAKAGTQLSRVILLLSKAALKNSKEHEKLNFKVFDGTGKMRNFADIIENLEKITGNMSDELKAATLAQLGFEARVQQAILPLLGTSEQIRRYEKELRKASGTTEAVANKQLASFVNQLKILKNQLLVVAIQIGQLLAPVILKLNGVVRFAIGIWDKFSDTAKRIVVIIGLIAAAIGPALIAIGALFAFIGPAIAAIKAGLITVGGILAAINAPLILIGAAIAALVVMFVNWMGGLSALFETVKQKVMAVFNFIKPVFIQFGMLAKTILMGLWEIASFVFDAIADAALVVFNSIVAVALPTWTLIRDGLVEAMIAIEFAFKNAWDIIQVIFLNIVLQAVKQVGIIKHQFSVVIPEVFRFLRDNWFEILTDMFNFANTVFTNLGNNIVGIITNLPRIIKGELAVSDLWQPLTEGFRSAIKELPNIPPREISGIEKALEIQTNLATNRLTKKFLDFRKQRLEILFPEAEVAKEAENLGELVRKGVGNGIKKAVDESSGKTVKLKTKITKVEAVNIRSAEALDRLLAFRLAVPTASQKQPPTPQQKQVIEIKDKAQQKLGEGMNKAVDLLGGILNLTEKSFNKAKTLKIKNANLGGP